MTGNRSAGTVLRRALLAMEYNTSPMLSPDGARVVFIRTADEGPQLWLRDTDGGERQLLARPSETVRDLRWTCDGTTIMYRHARRGREYWRLSGIHLADGRSFTVQAPGPVTEYWLSEAEPGVAVYSSRTGRDTDRCPLLRVELARSDESVAVAADPGYHRWLVDGDLVARGGTKLGADGSTEIILGDSLDAARTVLTIDVDSTADLAVQRFSRDGRQLFLLTSADADTRRLVAVDSATGDVRTVFAHPELDIGSYPITGDGVWFDPRTGLPDLCTVMDQRLRYHPLVPRLRPVAAQLAATDAVAPVVVSRSGDDRTWLVVDVRDDGPITYRRFTPTTRRSVPLFVNRPELTGYRLPKLVDFCFTAGDGYEIGGYAMRPLDAEGPLPTVVLIHGGPSGRDYWRFHADAHYLASLGYQSLHINYRGSKGFGNRFRRAGDGQWGGAIQQDLYDGVAHGIATGLVDPTRVAFFGASFGGYAALLAACTRPDLARCAIAISPPCDLVSFTEKPPPFWQPLAVLLRRQVLGRPGDGELGPAALAHRSPKHALTARCAPSLIAHGVRDPRVPVAEVDDFVTRCTALGVPIRYLRFDDEGHHVKSNGNREALFREIEDFLEVHNDRDPEACASVHAK